MKEFRSKSKSIDLLKKLRPKLVGRRRCALIINAGTGARYIKDSKGRTVVVPSWCTPLSRPSNEMERMSEAYVQYFEGGLRRLFSNSIKNRKK